MNVMPVTSSENTFIASSAALSKASRSRAPSVGRKMVALKRAASDMVRQSVGINCLRSVAALCRGSARAPVASGAGEEYEQQQKQGDHPHGDKHHIIPHAAGLHPPQAA